MQGCFDRDYFVSVTYLIKYFKLTRSGRFKSF